MQVTKDRSKWPKGVVGIRPHNATTLKSKRFHWPICSHCGLVYLKNDATRRALRAGCYKWEDE